MKRILSLSVLFLFVGGVIVAEKNGAEKQEDLASFFATKNLQEIENKINNSPLFSGQEVPGALTAFEDAMYNISLKNKVLSADDKIKIFKDLSARAKGKSAELKKIATIGGIFASTEKRQTPEDLEEDKKLGLTSENMGLRHAISLESLPAVKLFIRHGADVKKTNALGMALNQIKDLTIAKYLAGQGATLDVYVPNGEKYRLDRDSVWTPFGMNPSGQVDEKHIKVLLDFGLNINKIGYYQFLPDQPDKQGTILDFALDILEYAKKIVPTAERTQKDIDKALADTNNMIALLKKYGAKRSAELKK